MSRHAKGARAYHGTADRRPLTFPRWAHIAAAVVLGLLLAAELWIAAAIIEGGPK